MQQIMAPLPELRIKCSPVWHHSMFDLFGPLEVKNFVNPRTSRKTWAVIITCLTTRACWVYLSESYSTDHLLSVLKKHEARNGSPKYYYADLGRQILGADRVITDAIKDINQQKVESFAANRNVEFIFGTPHFPQGQGACERLIQEIKKSLSIIKKHTSLSFAELDCLLSEVSYHVNSRPLQPNPTAGEDDFICPNDIIMGRSDMIPPDVDILETSLTKRAAYKQRIITEFWQKWSTSFYQSLVKLNRWQLCTRNAVPGDVIMILDKETGKNKFVTGIIDSVKTDKDKVIRKVVVKYKTKTTSNNLGHTFKYAERNVRGLALLIKKEERAELANVDFDLNRFTDGRNGSEDNLAENQEEEDDVIEEQEEDNVSEDGDYAMEQEDQAKQEEDDIRKLPPISSGRHRWAPDRYM